MKEPLYQPIYKGKPIYKPVGWSEMLVLRSTIDNLQWRIVSEWHTTGTAGKALNS